MQTAKKLDSQQLDPQTSVYNSVVVEALQQLQVVIEFSADGGVLHANEKALKSLGYTIDELKGKNHKMLCEPAYVSSLEYQAFWQRLNRGEYETGEFKNLNKNGKEIWFMASYIPTYNEAGKIDKILCFANDITSTKDELKARVDIMNMTSIVSESDLKGDILNINEKFIEVSKYSREELIGHPHNTTRHPDMPKEVFKEMWGTIGRGKLFRGIIKNRAKDGNPYYVDAVIAPIMGDNGKPKKYIGVRYDITEAEVERQNMRAVIRAIDSSFAYIEFDINGNILSANKIFQDTTEYSVEDLKGKHHRVFCEPELVNSPQYSQFWSDLKSGKSQMGVFKRITRSGKEIYLQAVYSPVVDEVGRVMKVVKIATDVTAEKLKNAEFEAKLNAISKAQAVIEFNMDGSIISANENFLKTLGYSLDEIKGKHHRMFCEDSYVMSSSYQGFWDKLKSGQFESGRYKRMGRGQKPVWIQANYNPIFNLSGKPYKVVKFATDISPQVALEEEVTQIAVNFATKSKEISSQATTVAAGAQSLGATTEEMNASVEELSASIDSIAQNGKSADTIAKSTQLEADLGSKAIAKSIEAMEMINKSSEEINEIVKVISEIASQTNLLAFNAAIEAARAGEHGLGFSVVADEVRKLAERSSQATKDITKLINESVKRVAQGGEISKEAANAFKKIVDGVGKTTQAISEISVAAQEQQTASKDVAGAIQQVADATEKSASASDSIAHATKELALGADQLRAAVQKFAS